MRTLVLMRHGVAEDDNPGGDASRQLTNEGLERAGPEVPYPYPTLNGPYKLPVWLVAKPV